MAIEHKMKIKYTLNENGEEKEGDEDAKTRKGVKQRLLKYKN